MNQQVEPIQRIALQLSRLPGIGQKSAMRLAYHIVSLPEEQVHDLAEALWEGRKAVHFCTRCGNYTEGELCSVCSDPGRQDSQLCVVRDPKDVAALERMRDYHGLYHVLHGVYNPVSGKNMNDITLSQLFDRLTKHPEIKEVIMATNQTAEGNATALYVSRLLSSSGITVTRLASGLPMGSDIEFTDDLTLASALKGRVNITT
jgi:recombination protein RecR